MKRAAIVAGGDFFFRCLRLLQRQLARECSVSVELGTESLAAVEIAFCELDRRELARSNALAEFPNR